MKKKKIFDVYWSTKIIPVVWTLCIVGVSIFCFYVYGTNRGNMSTWETFLLLSAGAFMITTTRICLEVISVLFDIYEEIKSLNKKSEE